MGGSVWIINPDLLTATIIESEALDLNAANRAAVERIERWLETSIDAYQTIGVETVLSTDKYRRLVNLAHKWGFEVRMIYVVLHSAELQIERVRIRVSEGGHDVPVDKIVSRRARSFEQLGWFVRKVDACYIYDNSTGEPELSAARVHGPLWTFNALPDDLQDVLDSVQIDQRTVVL